MRLNIITVGICLLLATASMGQVRSKSKFILEVNSNPPAYGQGKLIDKIGIHLSRNPNFEVIMPAKGAGNSPEFPDDGYNLEKLLNYGAELGARYLLYVDIHKENLVRKKSFGIPLLFQKYQSVGIIEGEIRLIDIFRNKMLIAEPFHIEKKGPRDFQAYIDDNVDDASLFITAASKVAFFSELQNKLVDVLVKKINVQTNGR